MKRAMAWAAALGVLLAPFAPSDLPVAEAVADHDLHPGLGHPHGEDGHDHGDGGREHRHGDPDDHHETPDGSCHHHDTHTCCTQGLAIALVSDALDPDAGRASRVAVPRALARVRPSVFEFLHVPLA